MVQVVDKLLNFEEFLAWYPEDGGLYELADGEVIEVRPIGRHEKISGFIALELGLEIRRLKLPYFIPKTCLVKPPSPNRGYIPDVAVLDESAITHDPLWEKASTISLGQSAHLVIEIVSTNWRDDYHKKLTDYEELGIPEYWIVDYLALGAVRDIGSPKRPTLSLFYLVDGEYQVNQFRDTDRILSPSFPELNLTADQILSL
ncbi:hypothetical protein BST81_01605 [Leptolyngbya sp. 'hensonii']|uniref:Uma2 family endonuclease n=1 Tax=Leptolyngbya sp. 'hensonii' TaxID=1922337 RepID=UPI00094F7057|nr:Uma2 family endonuclease [Leptolyngbya sp. 'hensonii']OLP20156.1 hypothetical protein BST81_01605 [Leptolyngbya sp. 'hensonii']